MGWGSFGLDGVRTASFEGVPLPLVDRSCVVRPGPQGWGISVIESGEFPVILNSVPTTADRVSQTAAAMLLEERLEPIFHPDSYGYRRGRSAHDALAVTRKRCWRQDWVLDLDVRAFFDSVPHDLLLKAVAHHTTRPRYQVSG
jgi:hypothetical protein